MRYATIAAVVVAGIVAQTAAQEKSSGDGPRFEVASVKSNKAGGIQWMEIQADRVSIVNVTLRTVIRTAFGISVVGGPGWVGDERGSGDDRFDVMAKAEAPASPDQLRAMLRTLLAERFMLRAHAETRSESGYVLVLARRDGKLGPNLRPAVADCQTLRARAIEAGANPQDMATDPCGNLSAANALVSGRLNVRGFRLDQVAAVLSRDVRLKVVDGTALTGTFDIDLTWTPQVFLQNPVARERNPPIDPDGPSIFTALPEQLGLKLESTFTSVDVLVIDSVERPTPD